jgi:hypothetical protein
VQLVLNTTASITCSSFTQQVDRRQGKNRSPGYERLFTNSFPSTPIHATSAYKFQLSTSTSMPQQMKKGNSGPEFEKLVEMTEEYQNERMTQGSISY